MGSDHGTDGDTASSGGADASAFPTASSSSCGLHCQAAAFEDECHRVGLACQPFHFDICSGASADARQCREVRRFPPRTFHSADSTWFTSCPRSVGGTLAPVLRKTVRRSYIGPAGLRVGPPGVVEPQWTRRPFFMRVC